jgi:hypothetical protein
MTNIAHPPARDSREEMLLRLKQLIAVAGSITTEDDLDDATANAMFCLVANASTNAATARRRRPEDRASA